MNDDNFVKKILDAEDRYLFLQKDAYRKVLLVWILYAEVFKIFPVSIRLKIEGSPESGKSAVGRFIAGLVTRYDVPVEVTKASLRRLINMDNDRVFIFDEADVKFDKGILTILRAGYRSDGGKMKISGKGKWEVIAYKLFAVMALVVYYPFNDVAFESRCMTIYSHMTQERKEKIDTKTWRQEAEPIRREITQFIRSYREEIRSTYKSLRVDELGYGRTEEIFAPLLSVALVVDKYYPGNDFYKTILQFGIDHNDRRKAEALMDDPTPDFVELLAECLKGMTPFRREYYRLDKVRNFLAGRDEKYLDWTVDQVGRKIRHLKLHKHAIRPRIGQIEKNDNKRQVTCLKIDFERLALLLPVDHSAGTTPNKDDSQNQINKQEETGETLTEDHFLDFGEPV
ncbi:MAG: hypothetical protein A2231_11520 [Candidatus Firestonebacteria bacterium RIFOXYA2_FULL_40_8]|nr:MAG: hypothetical protein A2231_11520 [Candidatus Firestonebacteria bacterium RIFOXYA2_FULL_40_8]